MDIQKLKILIIEKSELLDNNAYIVWLSIDDNENEYAFFYNDNESIIVCNDDNEKFWKPLTADDKKIIIKKINILINDNK